ARDGAAGTRHRGPDQPDQVRVPRSASLLCRRVGARVAAGGQASCVAQTWRDSCSLFAIQVRASVVETLPMPVASNPLLQPSAVAKASRTAAPAPEKVPQVANDKA